VLVSPPAEAWRGAAWEALQDVLVRSLGDAAVLQLPWPGFA
jgi:hypothetical protein